MKVEPTTSLWAMGLDYGLEGQQSPIWLFNTKAEADAVRQVIEQAHGQDTYLVEVPIWNNAATERNNGPQA